MIKIRNLFGTFEFVILILFRNSDFVLRICYVIHPSLTNHRGYLVRGEEGGIHPACDRHTSL